MTDNSIIGELARRGIRVDPDDALLQIAAVLDIHREQDRGMARGAAAELPAAVNRLVTQRYRWMVGRCVIGVVVAVLAGFGAGYWFHGEVPMAGLSGGSMSCQDQSDGGQLCWLPIWTRLGGAK